MGPAGPAQRGGSSGRRRTGVLASKSSTRANFRIDEHAPIKYASLPVSRIARHAHRRLGGMADFEPARFDAALKKVIKRFGAGITSSCWDAREARAVVDYICVLTEAQAVDLDERLSGRSHGSMFGAWFS